MIKKRTFAKITGYSLLLMAIIAGFAFGFAFPKIFNPSQPDFVQSNLAGNLQLYKLMLLAIVIVLLLDLLVSWTLYRYFKEDNKNISFASSTLRIIYTIVFGIGTFYLTKNLNHTEISKEIIINNFEFDLNDISSADASHIESMRFATFSSQKEIGDICTIYRHRDD